MSAPSDQPPGVAHETNSQPHFLRSRGRPEKRKSPLQADEMSSIGMSELAGERAQHEEAGQDRGASPAKKVKARVPAVIHLSFSHLCFSSRHINVELLGRELTSHLQRTSDLLSSPESLLFNSLAPEDQVKMSTLTGLERDEFLARALQQQLDRPPAKVPQPLTPNSEQKRQTQLETDEAFARQLMEEDMLDGHPYHSDSDIIMTDDSELRIPNNSDGGFDTPLYGGSIADWNSMDNVMSDAEEDKTIKAELSKAADTMTDLPQQTKKQPYTSKKPARASRKVPRTSKKLSRSSIAYMELNQDEEIEKMCVELLSHVEKVLSSGKSTKDSVQKTSVSNASSSRTSTAIKDETSSSSPHAANGGDTKEPMKDIVDLTAPYEPSPAVMQLQSWYLAQKLKLNCHTCRGVLTIDNFNACELVRLWTGVNLMIKAPENVVQLPSSHLNRRFWERPFRATPEGASTAKKTSTKAEDIGELLYPNLCGTVQCKGYCVKVSCIICAEHCGNNNSASIGSLAWHCDEARPLSLAIILGALDEWVIRGKVEDAARRRKLEKAKADSSASGTRQRREVPRRSPSERKLIELLESEPDGAKLFKDLGAMRQLVQELCKLKNLHPRPRKGKVESSTPPTAERETRLLEYKASFLSQVDELGKQKSLHQPTSLQHINKRIGSQSEDQTVKLADTVRTTRSMSAKMAGLKDAIKAVATSSKQDKKKKSLFGHGAKASSDDPVSLSSTLGYPGSPDMFHDHLYDVFNANGSSKSIQGSGNSKFKKPNGTGYGGGPYYNSSFDVDDLDYDSMEEYAGSLLSATDSIFGASPETFGFQAVQGSAALSQQYKVPPHKLEMDGTQLQDILGLSLSGQGPAGIEALASENFWLEANSTKGPTPYSDPSTRDGTKVFPKNTSINAPKTVETTSPHSPKSSSTAELAWRFSVDYSNKEVTHVGQGIEHELGLGNPTSQAHKHTKTPSAMAATVESKQRSSYIVQPKFPSLVDISSGDEIKGVLTLNSPYQKPLKSTRASERIAKKISEKTQKEKSDSLKTGSSANDSIIIEPDSDEGTATSKTRKWPKRTGFTSTTKKIENQSHQAGGLPESANSASGAATPHGMGSTATHGTVSFHAPPPVSSAPKPHSIQYSTYAGLPYSWATGHVPHPYQVPPIPSALQSPPFASSSPTNPGYGWSSSSAAPAGSFAPMFSNMNPFVPYGGSGLFHTPKGNGGQSLWAPNIHTPLEANPQIPYEMVANGSSSSHSKGWAHFAAVAQTANPPTMYSRYGRSADPTVERKNHRQEYQDKVLLNIFKIVTGAMPGNSNLSSYLADAVDPSYPITAETLLTILHTSWLGEKMEELFRNDSMTDISKRSDLYVSLLVLTRKIGECRPIASFLGMPRKAKRSSSGLLKIADGKGELELEDDSSATLWDLLEKLVKQARVILKGVDASRKDEIDGDDMNTLALCTQIINVYESLYSNVAWSMDKDREQAEQLRIKKDGKGKQKALEGDLKQSNGLSSTELAQAHRQKQVEFYQDLSFEHVDDFTLSHYHTAEIQQMRHSPKGRLMHLTKELATMATSLPEGIFVRVCEGRPDVIKCLITGPEGTPYEGGLFEFDVWCPENYPNCPPKCQLKTTGGGTVGFNPNLYPDGKVCLSILGTWSGAPSEMWQPRLSTLLQVFISIQSMILCPKPYYNEPGRVEPNGKDTASENFNNYVKVHCVRYGMLEWLTDPDKRSGIWKDVAKGHFMVNGQKIIETVTEWSTTTPGIKSYDPREAHSWRTHRSWTKSGKGRNLLEELEKSISAVVLDEVV